MRRALLATAFYLYTGFLTHMPLYRLRHAYLRKILGIKLGKSSAVHMGCFITGKHIRIGNHSIINRRCYLDGRGGLSIGNQVSISPEVYLLSLDHKPHSPSFETVVKPLQLEDYVWIGARAIILPGLTLGKGCIVGAGAVVTRDVAPYSIVAGNPARTIGNRTEDLNYSLSYFPFFDTDIQ